MPCMVSGTGNTGQVQERRRHIDAEGQSAGTSSGIFYFCGIAHDRGMRVPLHRGISCQSIVFHPRSIRCHWYKRRWCCRRSPAFQLGQDPGDLLIHGCNDPVVVSIFPPRCRSPVIAASFFLMNPGVVLGRKCAAHIGIVIEVL